MHSQRIDTNFADISQLADTLGWDIQFRQLSAGKQSLGCSVLPGKGVSLVNVRFNRAFHQNGFAPPGILTFGLPDQGMRNWFGRDIGSHGVLRFNHVSGFDSVSEEGFTGSLISISEELIRQVSDAYRIPIDEHSLWHSQESIIRHSVESDAFRQLCKSLLESPNAVFGPEEEDQLVEALLFVVRGDGRDADRSGPAERGHALRKALNYIAAREDSAVTIRDMCNDIGAASRTLDRAFKERFGVGPKAYINRRRLNAVRQQLIASRGQMVIADAANEQGFWHMGQFARDYKALFGELPSETLRISAEAHDSVCYDSDAHANAA